MTDLFKNWTSLRLGFGGASISGEGAGYGFGEISESESIELLQYAQSVGVTVFDTAPIYGFGESEKRIGKAVKSSREKVCLISKSGVTWHDNKRVNMTNEPKTVVKMFEQSLRDLQSDYIDIYMIHWPDQAVDIRRPLEILENYKSQGKIKHIGLCNTHLDDLELAKEVTKIDVVQSQLNFFERQSAKELFPYLNQHHISFMSWGTLDKGILTGRVNKSRKFDKSDCRSWAPWWKAIDLQSRYHKMEQVSAILNSYGHSTLELALAYNLQFKEVSLALCGARSIDQLDGLLTALKHLPNAEVLSEIEKLKGNEGEQK